MAKAEEVEWRKQTKRYVDAYDEIFKIYQSYDPLVNSPAMFLSNLAKS